MTKLEKIFKEQLKEVKKIKCEGLTFKGIRKRVKGELNLMQKYIIYRLREDDFLINTSGTGTGKTIAALAAAKIMKMKTVVITNNSGKKSYDKDIDNVGIDRNQVLVINYDKFSFEGCIEKAILDITNFKPDFLVFDEVHNIKSNETSEVSKRRGTITDMIKNIKFKKMLIMSATPVINHVSETESLLTLGKIEIDTNLSLIMRKVNAYKALVHHAVGFQKKGMVGGDVFNAIQFTAKGKKFISKRDWDESNLDSKFEAMLPYITKGTIIYTASTTGVINTLVAKIKAQFPKFKVGQYSGEEKVDNFNYDIIVITSAGSTGTDGLQKFFNRMIFFSLPTTWAEFEQATGRIDRQGSNFKNVEFFYLQDQGLQTPWSDVASWTRINNKKGDSDMIRDGRLDNKVITGVKEKIKNKLE